MIEELASLLSLKERAAGAPEFARLEKATHVCLFIRDPELKKFLPATGFPQTLPSGMKWRRFLANVPDSILVNAELESPFSGTIEKVTAYKFQPDALAVLFGDFRDTPLSQQFITALKLVAALFIQEVAASLAASKATLSLQNAMQAETLAKSLSEAHDRLSEVLRTKNVLLEDLRQKEQRLELAREISGMGVWEWNIETNTIFPGPAFLEMHGLESDGPATFDKVINTIHPDDRAKVLDELHAAVRGHKEYEVQFRVVWGNGIVRTIAARAIAVKDEKGKTRALIGFSIDITNRLMIESALIRSEKLAAAGRLAASIAHEINNPLASIVNVVYLAKNEDDPKRVRQFLDMADRELLRISAVTRQTLRFYQDSNRPSRFDLVGGLHEVVQLYAKQIKDSGINVAVESRVQRAELEGWAGEIKQVVSNLLLNALHATPPQGRVTLRLKKTRSGVQVSVADQGSGIVKEQRQRIFEPFYSTKKETGTGLGLWVSQQIVNKHGGSLRMKSSTKKPHCGTVFTIYLPDSGARSDPNVETLHTKWQELNAKPA